MLLKALSTKSTLSSAYYVIECDHAVTVHINLVFIWYNLCLQYSG